jgi:hypothetical protein
MAGKKKKSEEAQSRISQALSDAIKVPLYDKFYDHFVQKVYDGEEVEENNEEKFIQWIENRLKPNLFFLDKEDYLESCIDSLKTVYAVASTDYGSSRQRDKAQLWSDMTRGYLGEIAVRKKFASDFNIQAKLAHQPGKLADFTGSDLPSVKKAGDKNFRNAKINISIKTTKWNGIWMDVPGSQYDHSDYFVLTKINTGTDHLMAFLKEMGFFETVMKKGIEKKLLSELEKKMVSKQISDFSKLGLFCYVCGIHKKKKNNTKLVYKGKKGRIHYTVTSAEGYLRSGYEEEIKKKEELSDKAKVKFQSIGEFTSVNKFIVNAGRLQFAKKDWQEIASRI